MPSKVSTIVVTRYNTYTSKYEVLVCIRNVYGPNYGKIFTQGGGVDPGETPEKAACRELYEEAGGIISPSNIKFISKTSHNNTEYYNFVSVVDNNFHANGPIPSCAWEIKNCSDILGFPTTKGVAFVPEDVIMEQQQRGAGTRTIKTALDFVRKNIDQFPQLDMKSQLKLIPITTIKSRKLSDSSQCNTHDVTRHLINCPLLELFFNSKSLHKIK